MGWAMLYLFVFLKLPILALCWIVWWAIHQTDEPTTEVPSDGGSKHRPHPHRPLPRPPRRGGPTCGARHQPPPRTRSVTAVGRARQLHQ